MREHEAELKPKICCVTTLPVAPSAGSERSVIETSLVRAVEQTDAGVIVTDTNGIITYANPAGARMTGYEVGELVGNSPRLFKSGEQDPAFYTDLWETIRQGAVWRGELINCRKNGSRYIEKMTISPVSDATSGIISYIAIKEDITEYRSAEQARQLLASIVTSSTDAIVSSTLDGLVTSWNRGAELLYGYSFEEIIGKPVALLVAAEKWEELRENTSRVHEGKEISHFEGIGMTKSGRRIDVSVSLTVTMDKRQRPTGHAAIVRDITAQKEAERALRRSEELYRRLFDRNLAGVLRTSLDGRVLDCNLALARSLGYDSSEPLLGRSVDDFYDDMRDREALLQKLHFEGSVSNVELLLRNKNGEPVWMLANLSLIQAQDGESDTLEGTLVDISSRKKYEQDLIEASERAQAGSRAKSEFLMNMSHELRTPLNAVIGALDLLSWGAVNGDQQEYLSIAKQSAESLLATIQQVLDLTGLDNDRVGLESRPFYIAGEMQTALQVLAEVAKAKHLELNWRIDPRIPRMLIGDPLRLRQIVNNLVGNAIKFTERGNVSVTLKLVSQSDGDAEIEFGIHDTGIGIPEQKKQVIFEVFGQADTSLRRQYGGLGLGLPISARLVRMMGGTVRLESRLEEGTKVHFTVRLGLGTSRTSTGASGAPGVPMVVPRNWEAFQRYLDEGHSATVDITSDLDSGLRLSGRIWSASEGFVRAITSRPVNAGETVQLTFDENHRAKGEVVFCQQWPNAFNLGIEFVHSGQLRREPRFPVEISGALTVLNDDGPIRATVEIVDISGSGLGILGGNALSPGRCVEIRTDREIVFGEVRYSEPISDGKHRSGIKMYQLLEHANHGHTKPTGLWKRLRLKKGMTPGSGLSS